MAFDVAEEIVARRARQVDDIVAARVDSERRDRLPPVARLVRVLRHFIRVVLPLHVVKCCTKVSQAVRNRMFVI